MASIVKTVDDYYQYLLTISDPRSKGWLLVDSPKPTLYLILIYLVIVWIGPKFMKNRKPMKLNKVLVPYNLAMAALNLYIFVQLGYSVLKLRYNIFCEPCRQIHSPDEMRVVAGVWWYYFSKVIEFADTFFFILRKKDNQLSFLHVYHHSTMFAFWWIGVKWVPSGSSAFPAILNSFIHVIMYTYYGLAAIGPHMSKYLWWKRYLTQVQLFQFTIALVLGINGYFIDCDFPLWMKYTLCGYMVSFLVLFGRFYVSAYLDDRKKKKIIAANNNSLAEKNLNMSNVEENNVETKKNE